MFASCFRIGRVSRVGLDALSLSRSSIKHKRRRGFGWLENSLEL